MVLVRRALESLLSRMGRTPNEIKNIAMVLVVGLNLITWLSVGAIISKYYDQPFFFGTLKGYDYTKLELVNASCGGGYNATVATTVSPCPMQLVHVQSWPDVSVPVIDIAVTYEYGFNLCIVVALIDLFLLLVYAQAMGLESVITPYYFSMNADADTVDMEDQSVAGRLIATSVRAIYQLTGAILVTMLTLWTLDAETGSKKALMFTIWLFFQEYLVVSREHTRHVTTNVFAIRDGGGKTLNYEIGTKIASGFRSAFNQVAIPFFSIWVLSCLKVAAPFSEQLVNASTQPVLNVLFFRLPFLLLYAHSLPALFQLLVQLMDAISDILEMIWGKTYLGGDYKATKYAYDTVNVSNDGRAQASGAEFEKTKLVKRVGLQRGSAVDGFVL